MLEEAGRGVSATVCGVYEGHQSPVGSPGSLTRRACRCTRRCASRTARWWPSSCWTWRTWTAAWCVCACSLCAEHCSATQHWPLQEEIIREAQTMRQQSHPNVLPLYCSFVHRQHLWMVMPYVAGGSVLNIMKFAYAEVCAVLRAQPGPT